MTTAYAQLVTDIAAALSAATPISNQVYRARLRPIAAQHADTIVVRLGATQVVPKTLAYGRMLCQTEVVVECYARAANSSTPDAAVDALLQAAYARIAGDATVNAATRDVLMTSIAWDFDQENDQLACASMTWQITHQVENNAIT
jgi:hypothetical protein